MNRTTIDEIIIYCEDNVRKYDEMFNENFLQNSTYNAVREYWEYKQVAEWLKELKEYKELEENGRLLHLPCKIGDKFWEVQDKVAYPKIVYTLTQCIYVLERLNKTIFLTEEDALKHIIELEKESEEVTNDCESE